MKELDELLAIYRDLQKTLAALIEHGDSRNWEAKLKQYERSRNPDHAPLKIRSRLVKDSEQALEKFWILMKALDEASRPKETQP